MSATPTLSQLSHFMVLSESIGGLEQLRTLGVEACLEQLPYPLDTEEGDDLERGVRDGRQFLQQIGEALARRRAVTRP